MSERLHRHVYASYEKLMSRSKFEGFGSTILGPDGKPFKRPGAPKTIKFRRYNTFAVKDFRTIDEQEDNNDSRSDNSNR